MFVNIRKILLLGGRDRRTVVQGQPEQKLAKPCLRKQAGYGGAHLWLQLVGRQRLEDRDLRPDQAKF
jgi:hypothetical protein